MLFSLAQRGDAPSFFKITRAGTGVPVYAIMGSCAVAVVCALINFSETLRPKDVLDTLMNTTGMIALLVYLVIAFSQLRMRRKLIAEGKEVRLKMWLFPWLTYLVIAFIVAALVTMAFMPDYQILVISTGIAAAVVVAMGVVHQIRSGSSKQH